MFGMLYMQALHREHAKHFQMFLVLDRKILRRKKLKENISIFIKENWF